ncbi:MAG: segregation and condensation protein A [Hyphomicrobiaceae bacterium]
MPANALAASGEADDTIVIAIDGYSGPLDLLLALARSQKIDLREIAVVTLADAYLAFVEDARRHRLSLAADYLVMAAWLTFLKSRLLLPRSELKPDETPPDELARRLAWRLARLGAMREAAAQLMVRPRLGRDVFARGSVESVTTVREPAWRAELYDLLKAYADCRQTQARRAVVHVVRARKVWSIREARARLEQLLGHALPDNGGWMQLSLCFDDGLAVGEEGRTALAASFGASLELARDGLIELRQDRAFAPLYLRVARRDESRREAPLDDDAS